MYNSAQSTSDPEGLSALALELIGEFTIVQDMYAKLAEWHLVGVSPAVGKLVAGRVLERLNDKDRVAWFRAVVADSAVEDVPVDRIMTTFLALKAVRDHIGHSSGTAALWIDGGWRLQVSYSPENADRARAVGALTSASLRGYIAQARWVDEWTIWVAKECGHMVVINALGEPRDFPRPSFTPPAR